jgi:hypothetical protein
MAEWAAERRRALQNLVAALNEVDGIGYTIQAVGLEITGTAEFPAVTILWSNLSQTWQLVEDLGLGWM